MIARDAAALVARPAIGHYESVCIPAAIGRTDAQGRFQIREPTPLRSTFLVWRNEPYVAIYKPEFDASGQAPEWTLAPTKYSRTAWLRTIAPRSRGR